MPASDIARMTAVGRTADAKAPAVSTRHVNGVIVLLALVFALLAAWFEPSAAHSAPGTAFGLSELHAPAVVVTVIGCIAIVTFLAMLGSFVVHHSRLVRLSGHMGQRAHKSLVAELSWAMVPIVMLLAVALPATDWLCPSSLFQGGDQVADSGSGGDFGKSCFSAGRDRGVVQERNCLQ